MPLNTVLEYFRTVLDGLVAPPVGAYQVAPLEAITGPRTIGQPHGPQVYIQSGPFKTTRLSLSVPGTKMTVWRMKLRVRWETPVGGTDASPVSAFSGVVDAITARLDSLGKQVRFPDPLTGRLSTIGLVGDTVEGELQGPWALASQRMQLWACPLTATVKELYVA